MKCSYCRSTLEFIHGHGACLNGACPMYGQNQAPCCEGDHVDVCDSEEKPSETPAPGRSPKPPNPAKK